MGRPLRDEQCEARLVLRSPPFLAMRLKQPQVPKLGTDLPDTEGDQAAARKAMLSELFVDLPKAAKHHLGHTKQQSPFYDALEELEDLWKAKAGS